MPIHLELQLDAGTIMFSTSKGVIKMRLLV
jgi:hypothetical protein